MSLAVLSCFALQLAFAPPASAQENLAGRKVVVVKKDVSFRVETKNTGKTFLGDVFVVDKVEGGWLWIGSAKGYLQRTDIVPLESATAHFNALVRGNASGDNLLARGKVLREQGETDAAITDFTEALRKNPKDAVALVFRAGEWSRKREHDKALADYAQILKLIPGNALVLRLRAGAYLANGQEEKSLDDLNASIAREANAGAHVFRGEILAGRKDWSRAVADYSSAIRLDPELATAYGRRASAHEAVGDYALAVADHLKVIGLEEGAASAGSHNSLGWLLSVCPLDEVRNGAKAVEHATKACDLVEWKEPNYLDTLAAAHAEAGDFAKAVEFQERAIGLLKDAEKADFGARLEEYRAGKAHRASAMRDLLVARWNKEADAKVSRKDYVGGREQYGQVLKIAPENFDALLHHADTFYSEKDYKAAVAGYDRAQAADPARYEPWSWRGDAWNNLGEHAKAIEDYGQAIRRKPRERRLYSARAAAELKNGEPGRAVVDLTIALHLTKDASDRAALHAKRAEAWREKKDDQAAAADYVSAASLAPRVAKYWSSAAEILAGSPDDAARDGRRAVEFATRACSLLRYKDSEALRALAAAHAEAGEFELAESIQSKAVDAAKEEDKENLREILERYKRKEPWRIAARP